jgi:hypothetical protein
MSFSFSRMSQNKTFRKPQNEGEEGSMKRIQKSLAILGVSLLGTLAASSAFADAPDYVRVKTISFAGSGCPAGSVAGNVSPDRQAFTLLFDQYIAEAGPGVPFNQKRKNCQINLDLDFPSGWSYTIFTVDYRGYVSLERNVKATQQSSYYFQGQGKTATLKTILAGPTDRNFAIRDTLGLEATVWSPCGARRALNINSQVQVDNSRASNKYGLITTDSIDGELTLVYGIKWTRCH